MFDRLKAALRGAVAPADGSATRPPSGRPGKALRQALRPVEAVSPELYERCVAYVHDGSDPTVLLELERTRDPALDLALLNPGKSANSWSHDEALTRKLRALGYPKAMDAAIRADRSTYYASNAPLAAYARLGRLFTCMGEPINRQVEGVPPWLVALLNDLGSTARQQRNDNLTKDQPDWTPERVAALARLEGVAEDQLPQVVFWALMEVSESSYIPQPRSLPGVDDFLVAAGPLLPATAANRLSTSSRAGLAEHNGNDPQVATALAPILAVLACDRAKTVRMAAVRALAKVPTDALASALPPVLVKVPASQAAEVLDLLSRTDEGRAMLAAAVAAGGKIGTLVAKLEARQAALSPVLAESPLEVPPFVPEPDADSSEAIVAELRRALDRIIALGRDAAKNHDDPSRKYKIENATKANEVSAAELREFAEVATGARTGKPKLLKRYNQWWLTEQAPSISMAGVLRLAVADGNTKRLGWAVHRRLGEANDLRSVEVAIGQAGLQPDAVDIASLARASSWNPMPPEAAWPWFATRLDVLVDWLGGTPSDAVDALVILAAFPSLPAQVLPGLATVAAGDSRVARPQAQALLARHGQARDLAVDALSDGKGELRAAAADWLAAIGDPTTIPALRAALTKEKREVPRAAMLAALETVGDDIGPDLAPAVLLAEAKTGLKAKVSAGLSWLNLEQLPSATWADGSPVDPLIVRWWVVLADKLKDPDGSGLIDRYLGLLDPDSAVTLGRFALATWVARDTAHPSEEESREHAADVGPRRWKGAQNWLNSVRGDPRYSQFQPQAEAAAATPEEQHTRDAYAEHQATYVGSASANRGLLALTTRMPGIELTNAVQSYIRQHGARRAQVEALMHPLFANGQPACIQLLLGISRRFRQVSVQETATRLVQVLADRRGWSADELADRTIPTAGFDDDRLLHLSFGEREFLGRITGEAAIALTDADGKPLKALPAPRADEDAAVVKQAKAQLTAARKELKSVLALQTARLYEAMCADRTWSAADWTQYLAAHPLVGPLVSRLVWLENPGPAQRAFRPADDGALLDVDDEPLDLAADARIGLAHRVTVGDEVAAAWRTHLEDYAVAPLFAQFDHARPTVPANTDEFRDLEGHLTDTFSFRNVATKRGYTRGAAEDGGCFYEYTKPFGAADLVAVLGFTGSWVPEENLTCATTGLAFRRGRRDVALAEVPDVLLAECHADYAAVAALGPFDPQWERKAAL